jgi:hypothetical protein
MEDVERRVRRYEDSLWEAYRVYEAKLSQMAENYRRSIPKAVATYQQYLIGEYERSRSAVTTGGRYLPQSRHHGKLTKPTRYDVTVESWQERDRLGIWITDNRAGHVVNEWWDDEAREMFEQGFFKPGVPQYSWETPSQQFVDSVIDYAESVGLLAKASSPGTTPYMPQTSTATKLNGLQIVRAFKQISRQDEDKICVELEAWALFPKGKKPHLISMYRSGDEYVIQPLYGHVKHWVHVPVDKVKAWIKSLPVRHFEPMAVAPQYREKAERLAQEVDEPIAILPMFSQLQPWQMTFTELQDWRRSLDTQTKIKANVQAISSLYPEVVTPEEAWRLWTSHRLETVIIPSTRHKAAIRKALAEGKPVPDKVLKDYPDLIPSSQAKLVPIEPRHRGESELEYFADSPEFLAQTIDAIGYRGKIDKTFQEAIDRAKQLRKRGYVP